MKIQPNIPLVRTHPEERYGSAEGPASHGETDGLVHAIPLAPEPYAAKRLLGEIGRDEPKGCPISKQEAGDEEGEWKKFDCEVDESRSQWYNPRRKNGKNSAKRQEQMIKAQPKEKMNPKSSCCQFYPIRLCDKRQTEERPKRKAIFGTKREQRKKR
ncbi:hypothetical protein MGYG_01015 [Nannizzia gypsea CBS 118893]|uniref:Uncharacterized protein n=1 Tax=Arthroderma gypseum (strain ATCC MYA-4604 / CBS 118893) TaxID=535722 RepID=E5R3R9_ARTGP|nr:hypothetical protein MGYG_01015 [Nannizzia gypsea CBS 118893]EFQ97979.1 hypothetical protein MGYG_01015 [Nannizzia gypsea CBS 118893]